ncbi:MAG: hypothetical protein V4543_15790 [Bacteroidota bacterium]
MLFLPAATALLMLTACPSPPEYPSTPVIGYKSLGFYPDVVTHFTGAGQQDIINDQFKIAITYQDGDGDLGLDENDIKLDKFKEWIDSAAGIRNPNFNNFFVTFQEKTEAGWEDYVFPLAGFTYTGRYPRIADDNHSEPVKGLITYTISMGQGSFDIGQVFRFKIRIRDRALHTSNEIVTDSVVIHRP